VDRRPSRHTGSRTWSVLAVLLAVVGVVTLVVAVTGQQRAPLPAAAAATPPSAPRTPAGPVLGPPAPIPAQISATPPEDVAAPVALSIPSLGIASDLLRLGLQDDGTVEVPPLRRPRLIQTRSCRTTTPGHGPDPLGAAR
jgi:hypothetical protein